MYRYDFEKILSHHHHHCRRRPCWTCSSKIIMNNNYFRFLQPPYQKTPFTAVLAVCFLALIFMIFSYQSSMTIVENHTTISNSSLINYRRRTSPPRILCAIWTYPKNHAHKAKAVAETWARHCEEYIFMTTKSAADHDDQGTLVSNASVYLNITEGRDHLWQKTKAAFRYIHDAGYLDRYDYVLKADDDTYVLMENLRAFLADQDADRPNMYGCLMKEPSQQQIYSSGGSGYVLSRSAVRLLVEVVLAVNTTIKDKVCAQESDGVDEDVYIARCLKQVNCSVSDTRNKKTGALRFFPMVLDRFVVPPDGGEFWIRNYAPYPIQQGIDNCCDDHPIAFHYVDAKMMYVFEYLIYKVKT